MKPLLYITFFLSLISCHDNSQKTEQQTDEEIMEAIEKMTSRMDIKTIPEILTFDKSDSIAVVMYCNYEDSALCCGYGEIRYLIDELIDMEKVFKDSLYSYNYCGCGDTIYLHSLDSGSHHLSANISWHKGDWSLSQNWKKEVKIN